MIGGAGDIRFAAWEVLTAGLAAEVTRVNAALAGAGRQMQLAPFAQVALKFQLAQDPDHQTILPAVHITPGTQASNDTPGNTPSNQAKLPYLSRFEIGIYTEAPTPGGDGLVDGLPGEGALLVAMGHYRDAVMNVLLAKAASGGLRGKGGVDTVSVIAAGHRLWQVNYETHAVTGGLDRFTLGIAHEHAR